ncbi:glycoside hydrolase family 32 protein [Nesterenkonia sp. CL21]|uniref:glycoside hydrolase family 32 protein n=1 Tax=Nesterenkonia sp. CL21 TaxID=3064894 RepID=UPI0028790166|nr:glycoside hydrolase family 32 protein [Nesterenkonia sp. CL21]MDS2173921.1 glycoside hydrolase family 32 protein [Nesterenkonia sp. CL21]
MTQTTPGSPIETLPQPPELRARAARDPLRPTYHFTAPAGWLNDPNGVAQHDGIYHLFYQHNPESAAHHRIHWGHAVSTDLVRWEERPLALVPGEGADEDGCWSGVLVHHEGTPMLVYSGRRGERELPCLAVGSADMDHWTPLPDPVIDHPPTGTPLSGFRDHCVWREGGRWRQLIGSGRRGLGGCTFLYESEDLRHWTLLGSLAEDTVGEIALDDPEWTGTMWECIDFFSMVPGVDGRTGPPDGTTGQPHVLIFSAWHEGVTLHPLAAVGTYDGRRFRIEHVQRLDLGGRHAYAPQTFVDESGRRVLWAWMQEGRSEHAQREAGWSGAMAAPRRVWLDERLHVCVEPVQELTSLRQSETAPRQDGTTTVLADSVTVDAEIDVTIPVGESVELLLFTTADGREQTRVVVDRVRPGGLRVTMDRRRASLDPTTDRSPHAGEVLTETDRIQVRLLLDASSIELFVEGASLTSRVYPTRADASRHELRLSAGAQLHSAPSWTMRDPWTSTHCQD